MCAIIYYHQLAGIDLPGRFDAKQLLRSAQRQRAERPRRSRPLDITELRQISDLLIKNGSAIAIRDRAVLLLGFASALRRSSIAALTLDDLEFTSEGVILTVKVARIRVKGCCCCDFTAASEKYPAASGAPALAGN